MKTQDLRFFYYRMRYRVTETWRFHREGTRTRVERSFAMEPTRWYAAPALFIISLFLRVAVARHMRRLETGPD